MVPHVRRVRPRAAGQGARQSQGPDQVVPNVEVPLVPLRVPGLRDHKDGLVGAGLITDAERNYWLDMEQEGF